MATTSTAERAGRWLAVSTAGQDEASQLPDIDAWIAGHGYTVPASATYQLHGVSRYKGTRRHDAELDRVIADMRRGLITVLVVWQSSRIERRGAYSAFDLARRVREAGGRIEYCAPGSRYLNEANDMSDVMLALAATRDRQESRDKSERVLAAKARIRASGALDGRAAWGYAVAGDVRYGKRLEPTDQGRILVPQVYARIAAGQTLTAVATWLAAQTGREWWPRTVAALVRNPVYRGSQQDAAGREIHRCEALVTAQQWQAAVSSLAARPGHGIRTAAEPSLSGLLRCIKCGGPVYRVLCGSGNQQRVPYYRCSGTGPVRKSTCKNMVRCSDADALVSDVMARLTRPVTEWRRVKGHGHEAELAEVELALRDLVSQGLDEAAEDAERARLRAERARLRALPSVPDTWVPALTGRTYADEWRALDPGGRREWLKRYCPGLYLGRPGMLLAQSLAPDDSDDVPGEPGERATVHAAPGVTLVITWRPDAGLGA